MKDMFLFMLMDVYSCFFAHSGKKFVRFLKFLFTVIQSSICAIIMIIMRVFCNPPDNSICSSPNFFYTIFLLLTVPEICAPPALVM